MSNWRKALRHCARGVVGAVLVGSALLATSSCDRLPFGSGPLAGLQKGETGKVSEIVDGDTLRLDNGMEVLLAEIEAPRMGIAARDLPADPYADEAKALLEGLALGQKVQLYYGGLSRDKRGRAIAHVLVTSKSGRKVWLQEALVAQGAARVASYADNRAKAAPLMVKEHDAMAAKRGLWKLSHYRVLPATQLASLNEHLRSRVIVEGVVREVASQPRRIYLNFGDDYRTDFTVSIPREAVNAWAGGESTLLAMEGAVVRAHGFLTNRNGPSIEITHPEALEVKRGAVKAAATKPPAAPPTPPEPPTKPPIEGTKPASANSPAAAPVAAAPP